MSKRILVVDDDPGSQKFLKSVLTLKGYSIDVAADGKDVPEKIKNNRPDLIIMDYMMPQQDGVKTVGKMLEIPTLSNIPIIFLTAMMTEEPGSQRSFDIKVKDRTFITLSKPIDSAVLINQVVSLIC